MKKSLSAAAVCSAFVLSFGFATASAQESVSASEAENSNLYFVELTGKPTADGNSLSSVQAEKAKFTTAAARAGVEFTARRSYNVLFNGYAVEASPSMRVRLANVAGVRRIWPVDTIQAPEFNPTAGSSPDLANALAMTGADIVQNTLGFTGKGIKVAVMDTGIDYDNLDLGGDGITRLNSTEFPNKRVIAGFDFVGDAFTGAETPVPDLLPDDCFGHGTHVAGIVGANGAVTGVAPDVQFGSYRVFGCAGSTTSDIMLAAMEMAFKDGMHVLNMSIGARAQWPEYPTAAASSRLVKKGMVVVASIGNNGPGGSAPDGPYAAGAPGVGTEVIGVASYDNTHVTQTAFSISPDGALVGYTGASASPPAPTSGSFPMTRTGTTASTIDACPPLADGGVAGGAWLPPGSQTGNAVLIRRGGCGFHFKARNAQQAGAASVILYNNVAGPLNATVLGTTPITIPVVGITNIDGALIDGRIAGAGTTLTWGNQVITTPLATGGLISGFSSFGMAADLTLKPDIGAPGGSIFSTIPLEQGGHGNNSGTSMSSPHVAGAAALLLQAKNGPRKKDRYSAINVRARLQNSAEPTLWSGNPGFGFLEPAHRQGAGLLDIEAAILASFDVVPGKLSLGESAAGPQARSLEIQNHSKSAVTFDLSHTPALATGPKNPADFSVVGHFIADATVAFSTNSITIPAGGEASVNVTITAPVGPNQGQYGGYVVITAQGSGQVYRVPYAGFVGDYQSLQVLTPTVNVFPWLAQLIGTSFFNRPTGGTFTMVGDDIPFFLVHLDHHSQRLELTVENTDGQPFYNVSDDEFVGRNTSAGGFFALTWDGNTFLDEGSHGARFFTVPDGDYVVTIKVTKALGDKNNPAHVETWASPVITIDRPGS